MFPKPRFNRLLGLFVELTSVRHIAKNAFVIGSAVVLPNPKSSSPALSSSLPRRLASKWRMEATKSENWTT